MTNGHVIAQKLYQLRACEICRSAKAVERHHHDGNEFNNVPENILRCCRRCHMIVDKRLDRAAKRAREINRKKRITAPTHCRICKRPVGIGKTKNGRCRTCDTYWRRRGFERPYGNSDGRNIAIGQLNGSSKLTNSDIHYIRASNETTAELARMFRVAWHSVDKVRKGLRWRHIK